MTTLLEAQVVLVGAAGRPAAATPLGSGQCYAETELAPLQDLWCFGWSSDCLKACLMGVNVSPGFEVLCDLVPVRKNRQKTKR